MTHDPAVYSDPDAFLPSRFACPTTKDGAQPPPALDPRDVVFGFGRRACAGRQFAESNVWLAVAGIVAAFAIDRARDACGREEVPPAEFIDGLIRCVFDFVDVYVFLVFSDQRVVESHPKPFRCRIYPRSRRVADLVDEGYAEVEGELD